LRQYTRAAIQFLQSDGRRVAYDASVTGEFIGETEGRHPRSYRVVVLTRENDTTALLANYLAQRFDEVITVVERPESRFRVARRRAKRIGWVRVGGQLAFVALIISVLSRRGRSRVAALLASVDVASNSVPLRHVESVNAAATREMLRQLKPNVVVVQGTRIISSAVLDAIDCPFVNLHAGITPRYRGLHGAYWALSEGRPDLVGTTVHVVDSGIDTGTVLGRAYFSAEPEDSIATYPYLGLLKGLPVLADQVERLLAGGPNGLGPPQVYGASCDPAAALTGGDSRLWSHPTLWGYLDHRIRSGLR
jgi:folate-dependent phosphoribosylglycinamide formyltransferase PurN